MLETATVASDLLHRRFIWATGLLRTAPCSTPWPTSTSSTGRRWFSYTIGPMMCACNLESTLGARKGRLWRRLQAIHGWYARRFGEYFQPPVELWPYTITTVLDVAPTKVVAPGHSAATQIEND